MLFVFDATAKFRLSIRACSTDMEAFTSSATAAASSDFLFASATRRFSVTPSTVISDRSGQKRAATSRRATNPAPLPAGEGPHEVTVPLTSVVAPACVVCDFVVTSLHSRNVPDENSQNAVTSSTSAATHRPCRNQRFPRDSSVLLPPPSVTDASWRSHRSMTRLEVHDWFPATTLAAHSRVVDGACPVRDAPSTDRGTSRYASDYGGRARTAGGDLPRLLEETCMG